MNQPIQPTNGNLKRIFLFSLIASVVFAALTGCYAILAQAASWDEFRIVLTSFTLVVASLGALSCSALMDTGRFKTFAMCGIVSTILALGSMLAMIWGPGWLWDKLDDVLVILQATWTISVVAIAFAHMSLLLLARLSPRYQVAHGVAISLIAVTAAMVILAVWGVIPSFQLLGIVAILNAAVTVVIPVLHRLSRLESNAATGNASKEAIAKLD